MITVIITTHNEEKNIQDCIKSAKLLTDDILVFDTKSTDKTVSLAEESKVKVINMPFFKFVEPIRAESIRKTAQDWVFILDADERMTEELASEIKKSLENGHFTHYKVPRKNMFRGTKWLKHGGWYPDYIIRLIKKSAFVSWPKKIHSTPEIKGKCGELTQPLIHLFHPNLEAMVEKTSIFEDIESELYLESASQVGTLIFFRKFFGELYRRLIRDFGFRDGTPGLIESVYQAYSKTITYLYLYEKQRKSRTI